MLDVLSYLLHNRIGHALLSAGAGSLLTWFIVRHRARRAALASCDALHRQSMRTRSQGAPAESLVLAARAFQAFPHHLCLNVVAHSLEDLGQHRAARRYWFEARHALYGLVGIRPDDAKWVAYYNFRETKSYLREGRFDDAFTIAAKALTHQLGPHVLANVDGINYEEQLRAIRMVSGLHHLSGDKAWESMRRDAQWILANGTDEHLRRLVTTSMNASTAKDDIMQVLLPMLTHEGGQVER